MRTATARLERFRDADPRPHEHERRRLRDDSERLAGAHRRPGLVSGQIHGIREFLEGCEAALMGRVTFEPALTNEHWPWPSLDVFVLASRRPPGTPEHVVTDSDPARLLEKLRAANRGGDVHLVGGPRTIETFRALGALDTLELVVLPLPFGGGMRLTPSLDPGAGLTLERQRALSGGSVEIVYAVGGRSDSPGRDAGWAPASQPRFTDSNSAR